MIQKKLDTTLIGITNSHAETLKQQRKAMHNLRKQKRKNVATIITTILVCGFFIVALYITGKNDMEVIRAENGELRTEVAESTMKPTQTRTMSAVLVDFDDETGDAILQTEDGELWAIIDPPEVCYEVTFDTKGTEDLEDDIIIKLKQEVTEVKRAFQLSFFRLSSQAD